MKIGRKIYCAFAAFLLVVVTIITCMASSLTAYAAESSDVVTAFESRNVLDDLEGATIGGETFDLADYPFDEDGNPQIISFTEFCYSCYSNKRDDYGLYVYVYNPSMLAFDTSSERNKLELYYADEANTETYVLACCNYSTLTGYEGLFYKFKVKLSSEQRTSILEGVQQSSRVYGIVGIELVVDGDPTDYKCAQVYTYSGYSLGYGSDVATESSLTCTVSGMEKYLSLDVQSTYWRPAGVTGYKSNTKDTLHSVYFAVPNDYITNYGSITGVHATWLNAYTAPILVTGNKSIYDATIDDVEAIDYTNDDGLSYAIGHSFVGGWYNDDSLFDTYDNFQSGTYFFNVAYKSIGFISYRLFYYLRYLFYASTGDADTYDLPAEKLLDWFEHYTELYTKKYNEGTLEIGAHSETEYNLVADKYISYLFDEVDEEYTELDVKSTDTYSLVSNTYASTSIFEKWFKTAHLTSSTSYTISAIQEVRLEDIKSYTDSVEFCNKFFIAKGDYDNFRNYVTAAEAKGCTVYLFRYMQSEYVSVEVTEFNNWKLGNNPGYTVLDSNAYFAQEWVQLDFDIIDLTFTLNGVDTVIPVISSPKDIVAGLEHPYWTHPDFDLWDFICKVVSILVLVLIVILLFKYCPGWLTIFGKVIALPFKGIAAVFKSIKERRNKALETKYNKRE